MLNQVTLIGHLGRDPEIKSFQNGGRIANLRLATTQRWKDRQSGEQRERTEWHSVVLHGDGLIGVAERYLKKGSKLLVQGKLQTRKWQDQGGGDRYATEIVLMGGGSSILKLLDGKPPEGGASGQGTPHGASGGARPSTFDSDLDDDVPF